MMLFAIHTYRTHQNYFMMCIIAGLNARLIAKRLFHLNEWFFAFRHLTNTHTHTRIPIYAIVYEYRTFHLQHSCIDTQSGTHPPIYKIPCDSILTSWISYSNRINESLLTVWQPFTWYSVHPIRNITHVSFCCWTIYLEMPAHFWSLKINVKVLLIEAFALEPVCWLFLIVIGPCRISWNVKGL